jgi:predicted membrane-bound spermidine synthase
MKCLWAGLAVRETRGVCVLGGGSGEASRNFMRGPNIRKNVKYHFINLVLTTFLLLTKFIV